MSAGVTEESPELAAAPDSAQSRWHALTSEAALGVLDSHESGLTGEEARRRLQKFGANRLPRAVRPGFAIIFLKQFKNPLVYLLLAATLVSLAIGHWTDAIFIFAVLQINALVGGYQEWRAEISAEALNKLVRSRVALWRDGQLLERDAEELVPGDVVQLESGARVPADMRLITARELILDESLLTGESTPIGKQAERALDPGTALADRVNMLFAGSSIASGRAKGLVVATGPRTEIGAIAAALVGGGLEPPPLVQRLERFSRQLGIATLVVIVLLATIQLLQGLPLATVFLVAVALAVAAIPEGLPVAITVALAVATKRMARRRVIVRALPAVEGLGACTLIASDKTGTLTCNELTIRRLVAFDEKGEPRELQVSGEGYSTRGKASAVSGNLDEMTITAARQLAESGALCNEAELRSSDASENLGDTVDLAFLVLAAKLGIDTAALRAEKPQISLIPYEPRRRYAASIRADRNEQAVVHAKGAAEELVPLCRNCDQDEVLARAAALAGEGFRVLAVARGACPSDRTGCQALGDFGAFDLLGLVALIDPLRPEVPAAIAACREAGIDVCMITGDHPATALAIGREIGIAESEAEVMTGRDLRQADAGGSIDERIRAARIFARVEPMQKLDIVRALQRSGEIVAVTGDGVNDAPALAAADLGAAMGQRGTDVARGAADLILADDNFASIVGGIEEGRIAYANIRKLVFLLVSTGFAEIWLFLLSNLFGLPLPLTAVQLLWLNIVTNGIQDVALGFEGGEPDMLKRAPRPPRERIFNRSMVFQVGATGLFMGTVAFSFWEVLLSFGLAENEARNLLLLLMVLFENAQVLNVRSERRSVFRIPFAANPYILPAVIGAQAMYVAAMYIPGLSATLGIQPVDARSWLLIAALASSLILFMEVAKLLRRAIERDATRRSK